MSYSSIQSNSMLVLKVLYDEQGRELSYNEINSKLLLTGILPSELTKILDELRNAKLVTEKFTVENVLDTNSKSEISYKITQEGISRYTTLNAQLESFAFANLDYDEEKAQQRFRKKLLIGCAIAFVVIIGAMIALILSTG